jgi:hypothetical protein
MATVDLFNNIPDRYDEEFFPYSEIEFTQTEVIVSSINEHGYVTYGHKTITSVKHGPTITENPWLLCDWDDLDEL